MANNRLGSKGVAVFCEGLVGGDGRAHNDSITYLDISDNHATMVGGAALAMWLAQSSDLLEVRLDGNSLFENVGGDVDMTSVHHFIEAFLSNSTLQRLSLRRNKINTVVLQQLAFGLIPNSTLQVLDVSENSIAISYTICKELLSRLNANTSLRELNMAGNPVGEGVSQLMHARNSDKTRKAPSQYGKKTGIYESYGLEGKGKMRSSAALIQAKRGESYLQENDMIPVQVEEI